MRFIARHIVSLFILVFLEGYGLAQENRPNIVLFIGDDLGTYDIGPYGNKHVRTPNLDALAKESLLFHNVFAAAPTCAPSRMSLYTGLYPYRHGAVGNEMGVHNRVLSIVQYFKPLGYKVAIAGKLHVGPSKVFDFELVNGSNRRELGTEGRKGMFPDLYLNPVGEWLSKQEEETPFVLIVADHSPHVTWPLKPTYKPEEVGVPPQLIDTEGTRKLMVRYYTDITKMDTNLGTLLNQLKANKHDNTIFVFIADQGPQWPFGKWTLYDYGVQTPLIIRWPGHIEAGATSDALISHVDVVPTLLDAVSNHAPTDVDGKSFFHVLGNAEEDHREMVYASHSGDKMNNRSVIRMLRTVEYKYILNLTSEGRNSRSNPNDVNVKQIPGDWVNAAYRDNQAAATMWRLVHKPREELYAVKKDAEERVNLAYDENYREVVQWFRQRMEEQRQQQGDTEDKWKEDLDRIPVKGNRPIAPYGF